MLRLRSPIQWPPSQFFLNSINNNINNNNNNQLVNNNGNAVTINTLIRSRIFYDQLHNMLICIPFVGDKAYISLNNFDEVDI
jgi:hypothetical protein